MIVNLNLKGPFENLPDAPAFPDYLAHRFKLEVTDGGVEVSQSIIEQGVWEPFETLLMLDILNQGYEGIVVDFGSHIGWYSILAALNGHKVVAYEELPKHVEILKRNARLNGVSVDVKLGFVDEHSPILPPQKIAFMKADIEGSERYAFRMYEESFKNKLVGYAIFEISPCFNGSYPKLVHDIMDCGYDVYRVPAKREPYTEEFSHAPLRTTLMYQEIEDVDKYLAQIEQDYFLFVRQS